MDLQLKQWRSQQQQQQNESETQASAAKIPKLVFDQSQTATSAALPLFAHEPEATSSKLASLSGFALESSSRSPKMGGFFSWSQWQELELQALIYRYMLAGAAVPHELLLPIKKSLLHHSPSYFLHHPLQHLSPHYQPPWYWGRATMDPEPGRCRRTDGKKWRCSRDVVVGHKYCERHMHRGRNRSRKPVEIPTPSATNAVTATVNFGRGGLVEGNTNNNSNGQSFFFSASSQSSQLLNISQSCTDTKTLNNNKRPYEYSHSGFGDNTSDSGHILRSFFDDWPRGSGGGGGDATSSSTMSSATCLSISMPGNNPSDVSLKLSTGNGEETNGNGNNGREHQSRWDGTHHHHQMGGPLAEALRSSTVATSSPTSVLHQLGIATKTFH
ncbi:PREDICTED: growth-regulating factor 3 [Tarenaya hassleriana]|uniref:growth-regulating factor 3 n=1 Tax=Tarenaya hassleriana TaxID=28532 RepID=UPI00053C4312|nr:PREDICTED: growth-regulating factor 3 [Tarenaya hassleriana]